MPANIDPSDIQLMSTSGQDTSGSFFVVNGYVIPVVLSESEVATLLASYTASSSTSPSSSVCRPIVRAICDALIAAGA